MVNRKCQLKGIFPAIASPCNEAGVFLQEKFGYLAESLASVGIDGFYVCGGTGDGINMQLQDRKFAAEIVIEIARRYNQKVIVHVGAKSTDDAKELAIHAARIGADAIASTPPIGASVEQLANYYGDIAKASALNIIIYYIPSLTNIVLGLDDLLTLLGIDGVVGIKYTDYDLFLMHQIRLARPDVIIFKGSDELLMPGLMYGADGGIGMNYNLFPRLFMAIYNNVKSGNFGKALELQKRYLAYSNILFKLDIIPLFEYLMRSKGYGPRFFRRPPDIELLKMIESMKPEIDELVADLERI